jgi:acetaldehyde dehydrogenase/alcohol dehydrogenase
MRRVEEFMERAVAAGVDFHVLDQEETDRIVRAVYLAALEQRVTLAKMAHEETMMGVWQHKVIKNVIASQLVYEDIKAQRTVGIIGEDVRNGIVEVARPLGPILALVPVTNPTSTTIFKILIAMKTRNPLIISPHQAARRSTVATAEICYQAALSAGAPRHCVQWLDKPTPAAVNELMTHRRLALILATGTDSIVRKAQLSGTPTFGVGPGNVPVYIGTTADLPFAVESIIASKTLDNGTVCASEQAVVTKEVDAERVVAELTRQGAHFLSAEEAEAVGRVAYDAARGSMTPGVVGQPAARVAEMAGISIPEGTRVLVAQLKGVGRRHPLSAEILAPILAFYAEEDFDAAIQRCTEITRFGGTGHTAVIYSNNTERIEYFSRVIEAGRILVNMPSTQGALGGIWNTLSPSFTLSCGSGGNNITTDNITTRHLLNVHRIARRRPNPRWVAFAQEKYLDESLTAQQIENEFNRNF